MRDPVKNILIKVWAAIKAAHFCLFCFDIGGEHFDLNINSEFV